MLLQRLIKYVNNTFIMYVLANTTYKCFNFTQNEKINSITAENTADPHVNIPKPVSKIEEDPQPLDDEQEPTEDPSGSQVDMSGVIMPQNDDNRVNTMSPLEEGEGGWE
ncbi:hypothetical protein EON65_54790, partial [archaeon]